MDRIKAGDVVQLKSGGPKMSVGNVDTYGHDSYKSADCFWFQGDEIANKLIAVMALKKVEGDVSNEPVSPATPSSETMTLSVIEQPVE